MVTKAVETQRVNYNYMADAMRMLEWDLHQTVLKNLRIPEDWHQIARQKGFRRKTRVTLRLDEDLVTFFRSMGPDWQVRVNRLMSVWMHARLAGLIEGGETMDYLKRRGEDEEEAFNGRRPHWGDEMTSTIREALALVYGEKFAAETEFDEHGIPILADRKPAAVIKAEYLAMKTRRGD